MYVFIFSSVPKLQTQLSKAYVSSLVWVSIFCLKKFGFLFETFQTLRFPGQNIAASTWFLFLPLVPPSLSTVPHEAG